MLTRWERWKGGVCESSLHTLEGPRKYYGTAKEWGIKEGGGERERRVGKSG
jgi:hypothetical protein